MTILNYFIACIVVFITLIVFYFKWAYGYWKRRNVAYIEPSIPLGNMGNPFVIKKSFNDVLDDAYREFKSKGHKFGGIFFLYKPSLLITDPELIKLMLTKDFKHFINHGMLVDEKSEPLTGNLLSLEDEKWKSLRNKLSPTFTSNKMKIMFDAMMSCADQLVEHMHTLCAQKKPLDMKEIIGCYSTDVIGSCAFGLDCNSFKDPEAEFRKYGRKLTEPSFLLSLRIFIMFVLPELNKVLKMKMFPQDVSNFFMNAFKDVVNQRTETNSARNDFVQLLLEMSASHGKTDGLSMEEMAAQAFIFFLGGFETTSTNLSFCLYELAMHQDIQQRVRVEILEVIAGNNGRLTYEAIMDMKYMDQVLDEALRIYPSVPILNRKCNEAYPVPGSHLVIEKGTSIVICTRSLHMDEEYFPNPGLFNPERFSKENKLKILPYSYLPFGDGPRICIGRRFAILQIKIALSVILKNFKILPHKTTPKTIVFDKKSIGSLVPAEVLLLSCETV